MVHYWIGHVIADHTQLQEVSSLDSVGSAAGLELVPQGLEGVPSSSGQPSPCLAVLTSLTWLGSADGGRSALAVLPVCGALCSARRPFSTTSPGWEEPESLLIMFWNLVCQNCSSAKWIFPSTSIDLYFIFYFSKKKKKNPQLVKMLQIFFLKS